MTQVIRYYTYKDEYRIDLSQEECEKNIYEIFAKYKKEIIIGFIGHIANGTKSNTVEEWNAVQVQLMSLGYDIAAVIHKQAHAGLYQYFCQASDFSDSDNRIVLDAPDSFNLFLLINQILDKTSYQRYDFESILHTSFSMAPHMVQTNDVRASFYFFNKFYNQMLHHQLKDKFDEILIKETKKDLYFYCDMSHKIFNRINVSGLYNDLGILCAIDYNFVSRVWGERNPKIRIPYDYRFIEEYPLVKRGKTFHAVDFIMIMMSILRKPYHVLSRPGQDFNFREIFTKEIIEPVIKDYIRQIFQSENIKFIDTSFEDYEYADFGLLKDNQLILIEIKSVYMGLGIRFAKDKDTFIKGFNKRYVEGSGLIQQLNVINKIENNFNTFISRCKLENKKYNLFCLMVVFDESFLSIGVNKYLKGKFNELFNEKFSEKFNHINPYPYNGTITFNELFYLKHNHENAEDRFKVLNSFFTYNHSFNDFLMELKEGTLVFT